MKTVEGTFKGVRNLDIYYEGWSPEGEVKAVLMIVHGVGEHIGRYTNVVDHYVPLGFAIYGVDHIGHGKSGGEREMVERFEDYIEPLVTFREKIAGWYPGKPIFIYGHSMGGLITTLYLLDHQADFKGAILSAAAAKVPDNITPLTVTLGKILASITPRVGMIQLDTNYLSHDKTVVETYNSDPLVFHGKMPVRLSAEMLRAMTRVANEMQKITLPVFILQGSEDKLVDPSAAQMLYDGVGSPDKTLKIYAGLFHEVHNEPEREVMFKDLETWLEKLV
ncbi:MAG: lysophospholipase [Anaerolineaceae bacterium]|jgi:alpha-beta hydrolase superfamily lysophospholipase